MLLNSAYNASAYQPKPLGYETVETLLDDVSRQMASSNLQRRTSRGSNGQRLGNSMRIVKPNSTHNSPRGSSTLGRRRTVMADGTYRRRPTIVGGTSGGQGELQDVFQAPSRPVSWHPSSHMAPQLSYQPAMTASGLETNHMFPAYDLPLTPAVAYSGYTSPASTFSPLCLQPYTGYDQQQQYPYVEESAFFPPLDNSSSNNNNSLFNTYQPSMLRNQADSQNITQTDVDNSMYTHFDWANFAANGFDHATAPPTPENFLPIQHPDAAFQLEEAIPYHALEEDEHAGEELIGMGLYDTPENDKAAPSDSQLDNYRALMMHQLLGSAYRKQESTGKGLKLEETWNPPASDDGEEDDEGDEDEDAEGSPAAEEIVEQVLDTASDENRAPYTSQALAGNFTPSSVQPEYYNGQYDTNGWL